MIDSSEIQISTIRCFDTNQPFSISSNVALVGNGGNILGKGYGKVIDSFDRIVRFNHAKTLNLEEDVGSRTTDLIINWHVYTGYDMKKEGYSAWDPECLQRYDDINVILVHPPGRFFINGEQIKITSQEVVHEHIKRGKVPERLKFYIMDEKEIGAYYLQDRLSYSMPPTAGFCAICALVGRNIKPSLFGFSLPGDKWDHYFEDRPNAHSESHSHMKEMMAIEKMGQLSSIEIH